SPGPFVDGKIQLLISPAAERKVVIPEASRPPLVIGYRRIDSTPIIPPGTYVQCLLPPMLNQQYALRVNAQDEPPKTVAEVPTLIAAATRKGSRRFKSVNEDAFLVSPLAAGEFWLAAIADGVSSSRDSWWASNTCMELLWKTKPNYERQIVEK